MSDIKIESRQYAVINILINEDSFTIVEIHTFGKMDYSYGQIFDYQFNHVKDYLPGGRLHLGTNLSDVKKVLTERYLKAHL